MGRVQFEGYFWQGKSRRHPYHPFHTNGFPAGAVDNYLAEEWQVNSEITIGAFQTPRLNFMAGAEQSFLDELAEEMRTDPIAFWLELLERANTNPVAENNDYEPKRYAGVDGIGNAFFAELTFQMEVAGTNTYWCSDLRDTICSWVWDF